MIQTAHYPKTISSCLLRLIPRRVFHSKLQLPLVFLLILTMLPNWLVYLLSALKVHCIWSKASKLVSDDTAIAPAPGQDSEARMVLSYSGKAPHLVTPKKGGDYSCDSSCPNWKAMGICAHCVAVAEINKKLSQFLSSKKRKKQANITNLLTTGTPKGRGRKGGRAPRSRNSKQFQPATRVEMSMPAAATSSASLMPTPPHAAQPATRVEMSMPAAATSSASLMPTPPHAAQVSPYPALSSPPYMLYGSGYQMYHNAQPYYCSTNPFILCFIAGNISTCFGCKNKYSKSAKPPQDLCVRHQEWRQYTCMASGTPQSKFSNAYYHCKPECIWLNWPNFTPTNLEVPQEVAENLSQEHEEYLSAVFGLSFP